MTPIASTLFENFFSPHQLGISGNRMEPNIINNTDEAVTRISICGHCNRCHVNRCVILEKQLFSLAKCGIFTFISLLKFCYTSCHLMWASIAVCIFTALSTKFEISHPMSCANRRQRVSKISLQYIFLGVADFPS